MAIEVLERAESTLDGALGTIENARLAVAECAEDAWSEFISNDAVSSCLETIQEAADDAWEACYPALEQAGDVAREGACNGIYLGGRVALGVADVGEDAYIGIRSNIELIAGDHEAAVETARLQLIDSAADAWGDFMQVDDQIRGAGDYAEAVGEVATSVALGTVASTASAPLAVTTGAMLTTSGMGRSLEVNAADGEISTEDIAEEAAVGGVTAASLLSTRGLNNYLNARGASETGRAGCLVDNAGKVVTEADGLTPNSSYFLDGVKCSTDDMGRVFRVGDDLVPNTSYELNGYRYTTDAMGRIESAEGALQTKAHDGRHVIQDSMQTIGRGSQLAFDQRGHLIADRFNGSAGMENIVAMGEEVNQRAYAAIENRCGDALNDGAEVFFRVEALYDKSSYRPVSFIVTDNIDGEETVTILRNTARG
ncbi:MAG TPA: DNA/RNA non-specific endonuclease [Collinsella ihuae]|uniref:DNA/RNA non-specific endonuclease n=1 Tax=Collinsella ihumii TaxID=1720204 RepID=A0A921IQL9_9ACTN|nr:DNA/RNA non-specific endonuclease [Collinsella ihumii]